VGGKFNIPLLVGKKMSGIRYMSGKSHASTLAVYLVTNMKFNVE
jgi:hypothetical protein